MAQLQVLEAESLQGVLAALESQPDVDLVLLDLHMPGNHGLAGLAAIPGLGPKKLEAYGADVVRVVAAEAA